MTATVKYGEKWSRDETILAFELYCRIPFRLTKRTTPSVAALADVIGRTPSSVARKLGNFGSFDPYLRERGRSGLAHASKLDEQVWNEFQSNWESLVIEAFEIRTSLEGGIATPEKSRDLDVPTERVVVRKERIGQQFFRESVMSGYDSTCCVTGVDLAECLVASHIVPWSENADSRLDPANGLCISATFDRLFDRFLMTVAPDYSIRMSKRILESTNQFVVDSIARYNERKINLPDRFAPKHSYLVFHNDRFRAKEEEFVP